MSTSQKKKDEKRSFEQELKFITKVSPTRLRIDVGFVPNMKVPAYVIVNEDLEELLLEELKQSVVGDKSG
jgi:tRNA-splicing ligase RtcB